MIVVIPAAGLGSRFQAAGYSWPKPLIDVGGKPMIQCVVENLGFTDAEHVFLIQREHLQRYNIDAMLQTISPGCVVVPVDGITEGAACTVLLAREHIDVDDELVIANSDQLVDFQRQNFDTLCRHTSAEAVVFTFKATHPKWSYVRLDDMGVVVEVAEKRPLEGGNATSGVYWWRSAREFVQTADEMIGRDLRVNGEFYVAPSLQLMVDPPRGSTRALVLPFFVDRMHGLGTPEDLEAYLASHS